MAFKAMGVDGNTIAIANAHVPPAGGGAYPVTPVTVQAYVTMKDGAGVELLIIPDYQEFLTHNGETPRIRNSYANNFVEIVSVTGGTGQPILDGENLLTELDGITVYHHAVVTPLSATNFIEVDV